MRKKSVIIAGILLLLIGGLFCFIYHPFEDYYERVDSNLKFKNELYVVDQNHTFPENKMVKGKRIGKTSDGIIYEIKGYPSHDYILWEGTADMTETIVFKRVNN